MDFAILHNCMLHRGRCKITYGGSKSGVGACLYNQQQHNMLKLDNGTTLVCYKWICDHFVCE